MELLKSFGSEKMPSVIKDPFVKVHIRHISVRWYNTHKIYARGTVEFQNGNTKGEQEFEGDTFDEVVLKIKSMIENL